MLANLLHVAGINHVITIDLHASQMQGFFQCPVDNLHAEPLIARWIRHNVANWSEAVCVSKNPGGTKRVTSLADALKLNFGMVTTDKRRAGNLSSSLILSQLDETEVDADVSKLEIHDADDEAAQSKPQEQRLPLKIQTSRDDQKPEPPKSNTSPRGSAHSRHNSQQSHRKSQSMPSPLRTAYRNSPLLQSDSTPTMPPSSEGEGAEGSDFTDERAREVIHGRLIHGHIVPDDYPSPTISAMSNSVILERLDEDPMEMSRHSSYCNPEPHVLGGTADAAASSDEEEQGFNDPSLEQMITLVGDVRDRTVFIVDDMIDKAGSWIAAAECVVKRGGAKKVYCIATHGLFGGNALAELQDCDCIDTIVVTNSFPIPLDKSRDTNKLVVLDLSNLLSEAIRRNHYGESVSALFAHSND